jgi:hypothetical protein
VISVVELLAVGDLAKVGAAVPAWLNTGEAGGADWEAVGVETPPNAQLDVHDGVPAAVCERVGAREAATDGEERVIVAVGVGENVINNKLVIVAEADAGPLAVSVAL